MPGPEHDLLYWLLKKRKEGMGSVVFCTQCHERMLISRPDKDPNKREYICDNNNCIYFNVTVDSTGAIMHDP